MAFRNDIFIGSGTVQKTSITIHTFSVPVMPILTSIISESVKEPYCLLMFRHENVQVIIPHKSSENVTYFKSSGKKLKIKTAFRKKYTSHYIRALLAAIHTPRMLYNMS